jgi:hypothetical protein
MTPYEKTIVDTFDVLRKEHEERMFALTRTSPLFVELIYNRLVADGQLRPSDTEADIENIVGKLRAQGHM